MLLEFTDLLQTCPTQFHVMASYLVRKTYQMRLSGTRKFWQKTMKHVLDGLITRTIIAKYRSTSSRNRILRVCDTIDHPIATIATLTVTLIKDLAMVKKGYL
jgi:hypothetical protein